MKKWKLKSNKAGAVFVLLLLFLMVAGCGKKEEEYRQIQVYKIDGTAKVERQGSSMEVYENMQLQSGDIVETISDSYLQLKLDEDKYILLEPDSKISLQATGNSVDSNTSIYLEKGAIVNQIDKPLSQDSNYQVTTPNSTMAVRGTTFRVEITYNEKGESYTKVAVYGGKVECNLVFPDGTIAEALLVQEGTEVLVWGDDTDSEYVTTGEVTYEELKEIVIDFLKELIKKGEELSITEAEIEALKEAKTSLEKEEEKQEDPLEDEGEDEKEEIEGKELEEEEKTKKEEEKVRNKENKKPTGNNSSQLNKTSTAEKNSGGSSSPSEGSNSSSEGSTSEGSNSTSGSSSSGEGSTSGGSNSSSEGSTSGGSSSPSGDSTTGGSSTPEEGESGDQGNSSGGTTDEGTEGDTVLKRTVIIKFIAGNSTFASKTMEEVEVGSSVQITEPTLKPAAVSKWKVNDEEVTFPYTIAIGEGEGDLEIIFTHD